VTISNLQGDLSGAEGTIRLLGSSGSGSLAVVDEAGAPAGTAAASATVTKIGRKSTEAFREDGFVVVQTVTRTGWTCRWPCLRIGGSELRHAAAQPAAARRPESVEPVPRPPA